MSRRVWIGLIVVLGLFAAAYGYARMNTPSSTPPAQETAPVEVVEPVVWASGKLLPAQWAQLSFSISGRLVELTVAEGDVVETGQLLARLEARRPEAQVAQAQAAFEIAQARLAQVKAGSRPEAVASAQAALDGARAELARLKAGPKPEAVAAARANLEKAQAVLQAAQAAYDRVAWRADVGASPEAVALQQATSDYEAAQATYQALVRGATAEEIAAAQAQVDQAQAQLELVLVGSTPEELALAEAQVREAEAGLALAQAALAETRLLAPFSGTVGALSARLGEVVAPGQPILTLGDLSHLRVETTDLRETDVARVTPGQTVEITFDSLPDLRLPGKVAHIAPMATVGQGGTNYTVWVEFDQLDDRLRWGMTAYVNINVER